jgi:hypothetical protein
MAGRKLPIVERFYQRLTKRWETDKAGARRYLTAAIGSLDLALAEKLCARLPPPLAQHGRAALVERSTKRLTGASQQTAHALAVAAQVKACRMALLLEKSKLTGAALIVFLAGLPSDARDKISTPVERRAAIALRKSALPAGKVRTALACSAIELDRWDADGRLPHLFVRVLPLARATPCRFWDAISVETAMAWVSGWREQDKVQKTFRRRGLKVA